MAKKGINNQKELPTNINLRLVDIIDVDFQYIGKSNYLLEKIEDNKVEISYSHAMHVEREKRLFYLGLKVIFTYKISETNNVILFSYTNESQYFIENFDEVIEIPDDIHINMNPRIIAQLLSISLSTTRGILMEKLSNTEYRHLIMPIVPGALLDQMANRLKSSNEEVDPSNKL